MSSKTLPGIHTDSFAQYHYQPFSAEIVYPNFEQKFETAIKEAPLAYGIFTVSDIAAAVGITIDDVHSLVTGRYIPAPKQYRRHQVGWNDAHYHLIIDAIQSAMEDAELEDKSQLDIRKEIKAYVEDNLETYLAHPFRE